MIVCCCFLCVVIDFVVRKSVQETVTAAKKLKIEASDKNDTDSDDEEVKVKSKRKISCLIDSDTESDSDSGSDYENDENESDNSQDVAKMPRKKTVSLEPMKKKPKTIEEKLMKTANKDESQSHADIDDSSVDIEDVAVVHKHKKVVYLKPDQIRDANNRRPDDPKYDPTTLYLPAKFLDEQTPVCILYHLR